MECTKSSTTIKKNVMYVNPPARFFAQKTAILHVLSALGWHYRKTYSYPSQNKICALVAQWHGIVMSRRTLNRRLAEMEKEKSLQRTRRLKKGKTGKLEFYTTLYRILQYPVAAVKGFLQTAVKVARLFPCVSNGTISLTTKRDTKKESGSCNEQVPIAWIKDFRITLLGS